MANIPVDKSRRNTETASGVTGADFLRHARGAFAARFDPQRPWEAPHWLAFAWILSDPGAVQGQIPIFDVAVELTACVIADHALHEWDAETLADAVIEAFPRTVGPDPLARAIASGKAAPAADIDNCSHRLRTLLSAARVLGGWFPAGFTLPQHQLADALECSQPAISAMIRRLVSDGWLDVADGRFSPHDGIAKMYRLGRSRRSR